MPLGALTISATAHADVSGVAALTGWALALNSCGALIGAVTISIRPITTPAARALRVTVAVFALAFLPTALVTLPTTAWLATCLLSGVALPILLTQVFFQTGAVSPANLITEANAWIVSVFSVGVALGTIGAGLAADAWGLKGVAAAAITASAVALGAVLAARPGSLAAPRSP